MSLKASLFIQALALAGAFSLALAVQAQPAQSATAATAENRFGQKGYILSPNDVVEMRVFQEDDLSTKVRVNRDGTVTLPLIGVVTIGGKSVEDASNAIRDLLAVDYLVNPQVTLTVVEFAKRRFTVLGHVQKPGAFEIPEGETITLLQAIAMAGGYDRIAAPWKVTVQRTVGNKQETYKLDAQQMAKEKDAKVFEIFPNDTIDIGERNL